MSSHVCSEHAEQAEKNYCVHCVLEYYKEMNRDLRKRLFMEQKLSKNAHHFMLQKRMQDKNF